jgi:LacI family transcriptional regulator
MKPGKAPRLEDVAARAGVSTATVSRCLNSPAQVVEETRARVMAAVEALGYAPNFGARALAAKRTRTIGAIIPTMENAIFAEGVQAFQEGLQAAGFTLLVASSGYDPAVEAEEIRTLVTRGAEGLLLVGHDRQAGLYDFLAARGVPAVVAWAVRPEAPVLSVGFDNVAAMKALATKAVAMGHSRIGVISAHTAGNDRARARVEGVRAVIAPAAIEETAYGIAEGRAAFARLIARVPDLTLAICGNDVLAAGAIAEARARGIEVPGRVSVTGFDDLALAAVLTPALTTVRVPHRAMGEAAAETLLALVEGRAATSRVLPTEVILRESLAPPRHPR